MSTERQDQAELRAMLYLLRGSLSELAEEERNAVETARVALHKTVETISSPDVRMIAMTLAYLETLTK